MALFDPCMEFEIFLDQMTLFEVLLKCHSLTFSKKCPAPSKCLSERINWIISTIPHRISKILFVYGSYEFLAMLESKIREAPFFKVQSGKITVCLTSIASVFRSLMKLLQKSCSMRPTDFITRHRFLCRSDKNAKKSGGKEVTIPKRIN